MREILEQNFSQNDGFISLSEASRLCGLSHGYLKILIHRGKLQAFKKGRNWFTTKECLSKYLDSHPKIDITSKVTRVSEIDVFKKIASSFSSDIVKELQELREAIKPPAMTAEKLKVIYVDPVKVNYSWNYLKTYVVSGLIVFLLIFSFSQISFFPNLSPKNFFDKYLTAQIPSNIFSGFPSDIPLFKNWLVSLINPPNPLLSP